MTTTIDTTVTADVTAPGTVERGRTTGAMHLAAVQAFGPRRAARIAAALDEERGAQTAEYGILTLAAVGFAGLLGVVLSGGDVQGLLTDLVTEALNRG